MQEELFKLDNDIENALLSHNNDIFETQPYLTTMTVCFKTTLCVLNINQIHIDTTQQLFYLAKFKYFKNSLMIKMCNHGIKIFTNGTVHVTGCKKLHETIKHVQCIISSINDGCTVKSYSIQMINLCMKYKKQFNLQQLFDNRNTIDGANNIYYDKERHPPIKIIIPKKITNFVFQSGSVLIMGMKSLEDINNTLLWNIRFLSNTPFVHDI